MADYSLWQNRCQLKPLESSEGKRIQGVGPAQISVSMVIVAEDYPSSEAQVQAIFSQYGGKLSQAISWVFQEVGQIIVSKVTTGLSEDMIVLIAMGAGVKDIRFISDDLVEILCPPNKLEELEDIFFLENMVLQSAKVTLVPKERFPIYREADKRAIIQMMDQLVALPFVADIVSDFEIDDEDFKQLS